jgi:hypothetical protein
LGFTASPSVRSIYCGAVGSSALRFVFYGAYGLILTDMWGPAVFRAAPTI